MSRRKVQQPKHLWQPMRRAFPVPLEAERRAHLEKLIGQDAPLIAELESAEMWRNDKYVVVVTRWEDGAVQELSIRRADRRAVHDWRDFQRIKSEIAGAEVEGFEMYPAESRLMDTANQYYLFCLPPGQRIPAGYIGPRNLVDAETHERLGSRQRTLPPDWLATP